MTEHADPTGAGSLIMIGCNGGPETLSGIADTVGAHARIVLCDPVSGPETVLSGLLMTGPMTGKVHHLKALPSLAAGTADAHVFSLPGLVSLREPLDTLHALFPGLRERECKTVDLLDPETFAPHVADLPAPLTCAIALPGAETDILDALEAAGVLGCLSTLQLRCGVEPFFAGASGRAAIEARVIAAGFVLASVRTDDPDWPELKFTADPRHHEIERLETTVKALESEHAAQHAELSQLRDLLSAREETLKQMQAEMARCEERAAAHETRCAEASAALQAAEQRYEQARTELAFQMRVSAMLQRDMDSLRSRFETSETARRKQEDLLRKLTPKLAQAASHLHRLQLGSAEAAPVLPAGTAPREGTPAPVATAGKSPATTGQKQQE